jgi:hypothetical protein
MVPVSQISDAMEAVSGNFLSGRATEPQKNIDQTTKTGALEPVPAVHSKEP